jgi:hypothetical protein
MRRSQHACQGVLSHQGLRKASAADPVNTGLVGSAGMAEVYGATAFETIEEVLRKVRQGSIR